MTELSGTLDGLGLSAIVRFLSGLHKNGALRLAEDGWCGEIYFSAGKLTHATLGTRTGLSALDALIELLPRASFAFDSNAVAPGAPTIHLDQDGLLAHLDEVAARLARGERQLPAADAVPVQAPTNNAAEEPVQLDRASLQTLMLVDGQRNVREIVTGRGSFEALWQLARLREEGLIRMAPKAATPVPARAPDITAPPEIAPPAMISPEAAPTSEIDPTPEIAAAIARSRMAGPPVSAPAAPAITPPNPAPTLPPTPAIAPATTPLAAAPEEPPAETPAHCPKLGFEDDPSSSFGRPTRLHRCFAAEGKPLPLSLDQQRELCLSQQYPSCPRLLGGASTPNPRLARQPRPFGASADAAAAETPRIVRLPFAARPAPPERDMPADGKPQQPRRLRPLAPHARDAAGAPAPAAQADQAPPLSNPRLLRAHLNRTAPEAAAAAAPAAQVQRPASQPAKMPLRREAPVQAAPPTVAEDDAAAAAVSVVPLRERRLGPLPLIAVPAIALAVLVLVGIVLLAPQLGASLGDNTDTEGLPNTRLVEAGTPVANLGLSRQTPAAAQATAAATAVAAQPTAETSAAGSPTPGSVQPTAVTAQQSTAATNVPLLDERFTTNDAGWPSSSTGPALVANGAYRIMTRQAGQFAAVSAPVANVPNDVVVSATFQKVAGPPGGGYGIIVRDQDNAVRDGTGQNGHYYVLEVGDKGEIGIWRRDTDHWVDLLPWQHADAVKPDSATNEVVVRAMGNTLALSVNGTPVASRTDDTFSSGKVGLFVGGDGNEVAVSHVAVQAP